MQFHLRTITLSWWCLVLVAAQAASSGNSSSDLRNFPAAVFPMFRTWLNEPLHTVGDPFVFRPSARYATLVSLTDQPGQLSSYLHTIDTVTGANMANVTVNSGFAATMLPDTNIAVVSRGIISVYLPLSGNLSWTVTPGADASFMTELMVVSDELAAIVRKVTGVNNAYRLSYLNLKTRAIADTSVACSYALSPVVVKPYVLVRQSCNDRFGTPKLYITDFSSPSVAGKAASTYTDSNLRLEQAVYAPGCACFIFNNAQVVTIKNTQYDQIRFLSVTVGGSKQGSVAIDTPSAAAVQYAELVPERFVSEEAIVMVYQGTVALLQTKSLSWRGQSTPGRTDSQLAAVGQIDADGFLMLTVDSSVVMYSTKHEEVPSGRCAFDFQLSPITGYRVRLPSDTNHTDAFAVVAGTTMYFSRFVRDATACGILKEFGLPGMFDSVRYVGGTPYASPLSRSPFADAAEELAYANYTRVAQNFIVGYDAQGTNGIRVMQLSDDAVQPVSAFAIPHDLASSSMLGVFPRSPQQSLTNHLRGDDTFYSAHAVEQLLDDQRGYYAIDRYIVAFHPATNAVVWNVSVSETITSGPHRAGSHVFFFGVLSFFAVDLNAPLHPNPALLPSDRPDDYGVYQIVPNLVQGISYVSTDGNALYFLAGMPFVYRIDGHTKALTHTGYLCGDTTRVSECHNTTDRLWVDGPAGRVYALVGLDANTQEGYLLEWQLSNFGGQPEWAVKTYDLSFLVTYVNFVYLAEATGLRALDWNNGDTRWTFRSLVTWRYIAPFFDSIYAIAEQTAAGGEGSGAAQLFRFERDNEAEPVRWVRWLDDVPSQWGAPVFDPSGVLILAFESYLEGFHYASGRRLWKTDSVADPATKGCSLAPASDRYDSVLSTQQLWNGMLFTLCQQRVVAVDSLTGKVLLQSGIDVDPFTPFVHLNNPLLARQFAVRPGSNDTTIVGTMVVAGQEYASRSELPRSLVLTFPSEESQPVALIVGLTLGLILALILAAVVIVVFVSRSRKNDSSFVETDAMTKLVADEEQRGPSISYGTDAPSDVLSANNSDTHKPARDE